MVPETKPEHSDPDRELYRTIIDSVLASDEDRDLVDLINLALAPDPAEDKLRRWLENAL